MRLFEVLTLLTLIPFILAPLFKQRPFWINYLPFLAVLFALISLTLEKYRWQMTPAYLLLFLCVLVAVFNIGTRKDNGRTWLGVSGSLIGILWLIMALALPTVLPVPQFVDVTGPYAVGTDSIYLVDEGRAEIYTDAAGDDRELMAQIWYPAAQTEKSEPAPYLEALDVVGPVLAEQFNLPSFLLDHINLARTGIYKNVPILAQEAPYPVIVFSHGLTGMRGQNSNMVRELVSNGFVVAAVDHTYANAITVFPDGRIITYDPQRIFASGEANPVEGEQLVQVWAEDIAFLLDELAVWNSEEGNMFNGRLDLDNIGVFGHSTGGGATLRFCAQDKRCRAGAALDSWVLPVGEEVLSAPPRQPFLFINSPEWLGPLNQKRGQEIAHVLPNDSYELTIAGTEHFDFSDFPLLSPLTQQLGLSGAIDSAYSLTMQNEYLLAFFNRYLKHVAEPLLERPSPYPELTIYKR